MPLAEKVFSDEIIKAKSNFEIPEGLADILNSLESLHDLGFTHRDLKPGNILFHDGRWKLADMGLITSDSELTTSFVTSDGFGAGSTPYMAPEQHTNFHGVTHHADIYSFGAILHDIFDGGSRIPYGKLTTNGPVGIILEKCTDENIKRRFKDVGVLRNVLLGYLAKTDVIKDVAAVTTKWIEEIPKIEDWTLENFDAFLIYIEHTAEAEDPIFYELNSSFIERSYEIDSYLWKRFILKYFEWINSKNFVFDYCDVLIGHIHTAYNLSDDLEVKSMAVLTAAELGRSHNRWYVMRFVLKMCSGISDNLANRIAIEIHVGEDRVRKNLMLCTERLNTTINRYHSQIVEALQ